MQRAGSQRPPQPHHIPLLETKTSGFNLEQATITRVKHSLAKFLEEGHNGRKMLSEESRIVNPINHQRIMAIKFNPRMAHSRQYEVQRKDKLPHQVPLRKSNCDPPLQSSCSAPFSPTRTTSKWIYSRMNSEEYSNSPPHIFKDHQKRNRGQTEDIHNKMNHTAATYMYRKGTSKHGKRQKDKPVQESPEKSKFVGLITKFNFHNLKTDHNPISTKDIAENTFQDIIRKVKANKDSLISQLEAKEEKEMKRLNKMSKVSRPNRKQHHKPRKIPVIKQESKGSILEPWTTHLDPSSSTLID